MPSIFRNGLDRNEANYTPLSPLSFLRKAAETYPQRISILHGAQRFRWAETYERCRRLASALAARGIGKDDVVAIMAPNIPAMYEVHFAVPMTGGVLNTLNIRLDPPALAYCLRHGEAKILLCDSEFSAPIAEALKLLDNPPLVIDICDSQGPGGERIGETEYEEFLGTGDPEFIWHLPGDEWDAISLNYTSGTTGNPKGVVYHHRGAYLNALGNILSWGMNGQPRYLWTLPMFHCNGWCFPWTIAAIAGTNICLRNVTSENIYRAIAEDGATHLCGAPIVMQMITNAPEAAKRAFSHTVHMMTAAAPPPAAVLAEMERQGFNVTHVYGLTETYGPAVACAWHDEWNELPLEERARKKARQGVPYQVEEDLQVADPETMQPVPKDGKTIGEVMMRGNIVMRGYLKNPEATAEAFRGGWFHSGDLGVWHPDNYIELKDRSKDIIISGGENISSIEVEDTIYTHPAVQAVAVVAKPDEKWGETPCAFVELKPGETATEEEIIAHCRDRLAHFKCPRHVIFGPLPKTATGKIQKFQLRKRFTSQG